MKTKISIKLIAIACLFCTCTNLQAQKIQPKAILDSTQMLIGDQVVLRLELDQPKGAKLEFPQISDSLSSSVEVLAKSPLDTFQLDQEQQLKIVQLLTITAFDTGELVIPPFRFILKDGSLADTIETLPVPFLVHGLPLDTTKGPTDIKKPYAAPVTLQEASPYILGVILIGALLFFLFYYLKKRKNNQSLFGRNEKPAEPAHIIALRELDKIKEEKLWQSPEMLKPFYSQITDTLRVYIENRFGIQAMEQTTDETLASFKKQKGAVDKKSEEQLRQILQLADLVKFAKYMPLPDDHNFTLVNAYFFVNETKIEEVKTEKNEIDPSDGEEVNLKA